MRTSARYWLATATSAGVLPSALATSSRQSPCAIGYAFPPRKSTVVSTRMSVRVELAVASEATEQFAAVGAAVSANEPLDAALVVRAVTSRSTPVSSGTD